MKDEVLWESERFAYMPPCEARDGSVHRMFQEKEATRHLPMFYRMSEEDHTARRENQRRTNPEGTSYFVDVVEKDGDLRDVVAVAGFRIVDRKRREVEWGIIVHPRWQRKGVCTEVFQSDMELAKSKLGCTVVKASTQRENTVMLSFLLKRGLKEVAFSDPWVQLEASIDDCLHNKGASSRKDTDKDEDKGPVNFRDKADPDFALFMKMALFACIFFMLIVPADT
jgi:RimJ/RimL family protein N-acetyltransferase